MLISDSDAENLFADEDGDECKIKIKRWENSCYGVKLIPGWIIIIVKAVGICAAYVLEYLKSGCIKSYCKIKKLFRVSKKWKLIKTFFFAKSTDTTMQ